MIVGIKDIVKMAAISVVSLCAVFVCALFVNYGIDIASVEALITTPEAQMMYDTQIATSKVIVGASGGSLAFTSVILLIFYIKNYIDSHRYIKSFGIFRDQHCLPLVGVCLERVCGNFSRLCRCKCVYASTVRTSK